MKHDFVSCSRVLGADALVVASADTLHSDDRNPEICLCVSRWSTHGSAGTRGGAQAAAEEVSAVLGTCRVGVGMADPTGTPGGDVARVVEVLVAGPFAVATKRG